MKWLVPAFLVLVLAGSGGVAYACGGDGGGGGGGGGGNHCNGPQDGGNSCPSLDIVWQNPSSVKPGPYVQCALTLNSSTLLVEISELSPGTNCTFYAVLANVGKDDVTLTENVTIDAPSTCPMFTYSDDIPSTPSRELSSGDTYGFHGVAGLSSAAGNRCQGAVATILVTISASQATSCGGGGSGGGGGWLPLATSPRESFRA